MGLISASGKMFKAAAKDGSRVMAGKLGNVSEAVASAFKNGSKAAQEAADAGFTKGINKYAKIFADDYADTATKWQMRANKLYDKAAGRMTPAVISGSGSEAINGAVRNVDKVARNNTIKGSLIGGVGGAGLGGLTGVVTGADEDNQKAMTVSGAIGGAIIGGFTGRVLGGRGIARAGSKAVSSSASAATALAAQADDAVEVASSIARGNATTGYAGIDHVGNLLSADNIRAIGTTATDIVPESHRLTGTLSLPGAVALDGGQMIVG